LPPPGLQIKKRAAGESMKPTVSSGWDSSMSSSGEDGIQVETSQPQTFKTSQLRPAKGLGRPQHPMKSRPGPSLTRAASECGHDAFTTTPKSPAIIRPSPNELYRTQSSYPGEQHPTTAPALSSRPMNEHNGDNTQTRPRHPSILRPGTAMPSRSMSDCGNESTLKRMSLTHYEPETLLYSQPAPRSNQTARPVSIYSAYQPPVAQPDQRQRDHTVRASVSLYDTSNHSYGGETSDDDDVRSNYSTATYSHVPRAGAHPSRRGAQSTRQTKFAEVYNQRNSQVQACRPPSRSITRVDGVDFEMVSSAVASTPAPALAAAATPAPMPPSVRGRPTSAASSTYSRSRSPSPAYGAWESDRPRQKRASFLDRAQERIERSINDKLVKAGRRPLPSFKVNRVEKSPTEAVAMWEGKSLPPPPPSSQAQASPRERIPTPQGGTYVEHRERRPMATTSTGAKHRPERQGERRESWEISSGSEAEDETELFFSMQYQSRAPILPAPASALRAAAAPIMRRGTPELRINTSFANVPVGVAELEAPLEPFPDFNVEDEVEGAPTLPRNDDDDSLFLGHGQSGIRHPASYSFFSSDYAQRQVAARMETDQIAQQPRKKQHPSTQPQMRSQAQLPRVQSSASMYRSGEEVEVELPRTRSSAALSREQLGFAALPSPLEDLRQPFPFDDRRSLPSQTGHEVVSHLQGQQNDNTGRTLTRKKGRQLR
jgi:hypothetical protein